MQGSIYIIIDYFIVEPANDVFPSLLINKRVRGNHLGNLGQLIYLTSPMVFIVVVWELLRRMHLEVFYLYYRGFFRHALLFLLNVYKAIFDLIGARQIITILITSTWYILIDGKILR